MAGDLTWSDLLKVDAGSWYSGEFKGEPLPLLSEVADRCRLHGMMANIEIKPTTGTGPLTGKAVALAARELWQGMTPAATRRLKSMPRKPRRKPPPSCRAGCCWMSGGTTGAN